MVWKAKLQAPIDSSGKNWSRVFLLLSCSSASHSASYPYTSSHRYRFMQCFDFIWPIQSYEKMHEVPLNQVNIGCMTSCTWFFSRYFSNDCIIMVYIKFFFCQRVAGTEHTFVFAVQHTWETNRYSIEFGGWRGAAEWLQDWVQLTFECIKICITLED